MAIGSISAGTPAPAPTKVAPAEATEATRAGKDVKNDGDADDAGTKAQAASTAPVINSLGQQLGRNLNVTA